MKHPRLVILLFFLISPALISASALVPENFQYSRPVPGPLLSGKVYKLTLPGEVLNHTAIDQRDIRIFSPDGTLVPFTILEEHRKTVHRTQYKLKIRDFSTSGKTIIIILEAPSNIEPLRMLYFSTPNRNFKKSVNISVSDNQKSWTSVANGQIYDFSRNVDLRKTFVSFEPVKSQWFRVILTDVELPPNNEAIQLNYRGLHFSSTGESPRPFRINRVTAFNRSRKVKPELTESMELKNFSIMTGKDGNTVILFSTGIPLASVSIVPETAAFYRKAILKGERISLNRQWIPLARGEFYRFVLGKGTETKLTLATNPSDTGNYKLIIINRDNTPLKITRLRLNWIRHNLFFVPESKTIPSAVLCYGNPKVPEPRFDVKRFVRPDNWERQTPISVKPGNVTENPAFRPEKRTWTPDFSRVVLLLIVLMVTIVLGIWTFRLIGSH